MKRKALGLFLAVTLILSCFVGMMLVADAEGANKIVFAAGDLTVDELGVEGATYTTDLLGALSALDENSRKHPSDATAEIHFKGNLTGGDQGNLLFAQKTIWREDGTKLPISIIGHDTASERDAYIYLDAIGGWYTCANDYTFVNLTLPVGDQETYFYAGSGNIRLDNVNLMSAGDLTVETVAERTEYYQNAKAAAEYIVADAAGLITPDMTRLPAGDAWEKVRSSAEYHATGTVKTDKNGAAYVDKDPTGADGALYGDYAHSGNTGGGQYLNACVYYEAILGLECKDNSWRPTAYALDETLVPIMQKAAHDAVLEVYGEAHFTNPPKYDVNEDGTVNLLMIGSSSSYYMRDELHLMAKHAGIDLRVVHAYSSGIKMKTMWSWTENANGKWTVYTDYDSTTKSVESQKFTDFVADFPWDAIVTYETGGSFNKKNLKVAGYNEASIASSLAYIEKADEFINEIYNYNADNAKARYFWFQTISAPIGAPGPSSDAKGFVFGDNNTTAAYAGWTAEDLERYSENGKVVSSVTMGEGMNFGTRINAVGYMLTAPETPFTDETAAEVKFIELTGYENVPSVLPVNTLGKLILDSDTAAIDMTPIKRGYSPASAELHIKKGSGGAVNAYGYDAKNLTKYGDITFRWTGGSVGQIDLINYSDITGDLNVIIDLPEGNNASIEMLRVTFNPNVITGDINVSAKNLTVTGSVFCGGGAGGVVNNTFENCNLGGDFYAVRSGKCGKIVNTFKNTTIGGVYCGGHWSGNATEVGPIVNDLDGVTLTGTGTDKSAGVFFGGSSSGGGAYTAKVTAGPVEVNGKTETLSIYNKIGSLKLTGSFYAGIRSGSCGDIRNDIDRIEGTTFYGAGAASGKVGNTTTKIKTAILTGNFYGGTAGTTANSVKNINTDIENITLTGKFYGGNLKSTVNGDISTTIRGGTFNGYYYGGSASGVVKNVTNIIYGGTFKTAFFGGCPSSNAGQITNTVYAGTFSSNFYGANDAGGTAASVTNTVHGGTFAKNFYAAFYAVSSTSENITNIVHDIDLTGNFYGAGRAGKITNVSNTIHKGTFKGDFFGGAATADSVNGKITNTVYDMNLAKKFAGAGFAGTVNGNVTNNIYGGTFAGSIGGAFICAGAEATMVINGDIINNVSGPVTISGTFNGSLACDSSGHGTPTVTGTVINTFDKNEKGEAPAFDTSNNYCYFGTGHHGVPDGGVVNIIKAGTFYRLWQGGPFYLYGGTMGLVPDDFVPAGIEKGKYSVINLVSGGVFNHNADGRAYFWGSICAEKGGTYTGGVYTQVSGNPVFNTRLIGGYRGFAADETHPVTVKISGGTFNHDVFMLSSQLGTSLSGTVHTGNAIITGGTFNKNVYGGSNGAGSATNATLTVQGGTFKGELIASSAPKSGTEITGSFTLNLEPTAGNINLKNAVSAQNDAETIALKGGDKMILIDADTGIIADSYDGKALTIQQTAGFVTDTVYVSLPAGVSVDQLTVTKARAAAGYVMKKTGETETQWIGLEKTSVKAVNLILDKKIGVRLWLDKAEVDTIGTDFIYNIMLDGKSVAFGTYADLLQNAEIKTQTEGGAEFYTLRISGTEPASFHKAMTIKGIGLEEKSMSINDVLSIVIANEASQFSTGFVTLAKSLWNYGIEAYNRFSGETSSLTKQEISLPENAANAPLVQMGDDDDVKMVGRALALREAVGIRIYLNLQNGVKVSDLTFVVNGNTIPESLLNIREESGAGYNASVTLYISATAMDQFLTISVHHGQIFAGGYTDSVASICQQYRNAGGADAQLCTAILRYIQAIPGMND